jgi:hypothetical protein
VDVPKDKAQFVVDFVAKEWKMTGSLEQAAMSPVVGIWGAVNTVRKMGPAPFIDLLKMCRTAGISFNPFDAPNDQTRPAYLDAFYCFLLPMLDGIQFNEAEQVSKGVGQALALAEDDEQYKTLLDRLTDISIKI